MADKLYGTAHQKARARYKRNVVDPGDAYCTRCRGWINPDEPWHLDHDDLDKTLYLGAAHARCNEVAGARRGGKATAAKRRPAGPTTSRVW